MKKLLSPVASTGLLTLALTFFALSCQKNTSKPGSNAGQTGLKIFLTDDPALSFDAVLIDIQKLEVKVEDSLQVEDERHDENGHDDRDRHGDTDGGWMTLDIRPGIYDILKFRNGLDTLLASASFPSVRSLHKIRLTLGSNNSVTFNGTSHPLVIKDNDNRVVIKLDDDNLLAGSGPIDLSLDFDAGRSIRLHGNTFELKPQIRTFGRQKAGSIEGRVLPAAAQAVVLAIDGTDTLSAKPEREGEFKIVGLKQGSYSLLYHATTGNYKDTVISNVLVSGREDTHVATVTLHP